MWDGKLLTADEYFDQETRDKAIRVDGHYTGKRDYTHKQVSKKVCTEINDNQKGWINPELIEKYQFESSAAEAWEKNGGGKFSYKDPLGTGKKKSGSGRFNAKVWNPYENPWLYIYLTDLSSSTGGCTNDV